MDLLYPLYFLQLNYYVKIVFNFLFDIPYLYPMKPSDRYIDKDR